MEPAEDTSLEAAIRWLVGTILGFLLTDKLDAWVRGVNLDDDVAKLKFEVERAESLIDDVRGRADGNKSLARSLARLKGLLYDADDLVDELDYYRLQQQVEGVTRDEPEGMHGAQRVDEIEMSNGDDADRPKKSIVGKPRSLVWYHFEVTERVHGKPVSAKCNHCGKEYPCKSVENGTSTMRTHVKKKHAEIWDAEAERTMEPTVNPPNPSSTGDAPGSVTATEVATSSSSRKRKRANKEPAQTTTATTHTPWDKAELSNRIQTITSQLQGILEALSKLLERHGSGCASSSNHHQSAILDQNLRTSSLLQAKVYGRDAEKDFIVKLITEDQSDVVTVLPIVGIAGVGKTALAQLVYNDSGVESKFQHRIWASVSRKFDELRLTREMLEFLSEERHEGISSFAKLQEILKSHAKSKRLLIIFDDVWDDMKDCRWDKLLAPFVSGQSNEVVILVTTRNYSVAKRLGTLKPVKLSALKNKDFWLLFKSRTFGGGDYEGPRNLSTIGQKIAEKLKGNPLAAVSIGALLREDLNVDHWSNILEKEDWKSLGLREGIMPALKLSYDQLPYHLQLCFSYCSIFPNKHKFLGKDLVYIWISQGFVNSTCLTKRLEETGWEYLTDLVNLGFFQQVEEEEEFSPDSQIWYSACGLMHDFARIVSRTECATIDGLQCNKMLPTIRHLSIVTDSAYNSKDQHGNIPRNEKFEDKLRNTVISVRKLRTLVLIGKYDSHFFQVFQDKFRIAHNLRMLQMSVTSADSNSLMCSLLDPTHLRYVKHKSDGLDRGPPLVLIKFFHLQVLDVASNNNPSVPDGMNNLVSLRHLVAGFRVYSSIANIGSMTSLQELHDFKVQSLSGSFEISQLQYMNELVELWVSQLDNVESREEAYGAGLRDKVHLAKLHLSWKDALSDEEYSPDYSSESSEELLPMDGGGPSYEPSMDTAKEVIEGLEPHMDLKHLQVSRYNGTTSPTWLASNISVTSLQTLHLHDCGAWRILPSLESLPFLRKLKLSSMQEVTEVLVPSLEEIVLIRMPKLVRCSSTSVETLSSNLRVLQIEKCHALKEFDLFANYDESEIEQRSWLPCLRELNLRDCPHLGVLNPLPPSNSFSELLIRKVSRLPSLTGPSSDELHIGLFREDADDYEIFDEYSDELVRLDDKILAFHNLRNLTSLTIDGCRNLMSISFKGFCQLVSLKVFEIRVCEKLFSSDVIINATHGDMTGANCKPFPSLKTLEITECGITEKWLSLMLHHAPDLTTLSLMNCPHITLLSIEEEENSPNIITARQGSSSGNQDVSFRSGPHVTFNGSKNGFSAFTCLEDLTISFCRNLFSSLVHNGGSDDLANGRWLLPTSLRELDIAGYSEKTLQPCFPCDLTTLTKLKVRFSSRLESLQLQSCNVLRMLIIYGCESLSALEGLQLLPSLKRLKISLCRGISRLPKTGLPLSLEELEIDGCRKELDNQCRLLATSKLRVKIDGDWLNL